MRLSEAVALFLDQRRIEGLSPHSLKGYRYQFIKLMRHTGDIPVEELTLPLIRQYLASLTGYKVSTLGLRIRLLRVFGRWLQEEGYCQVSPAAKLKEPRLPQRVPKALSVEELELLRDACRGPREHALIEFLFSTGCRASEVAGVKRLDVDWTRRALVVFGKGSKEREVYLGAKAAIWLRRYQDKRTDDCPALFVTERRPYRPMTAHMLWYNVKRIARRAGMDDRVWPHILRHTLGTTLLNQGAPLAAVQSIFGHSNPQTTQIYAVLSGASRQQAFQRYFVQ